MGFFNELVKFTKMAKNVPFFSEAFLGELLHVNKVVSEEYVNYIAKCFSFLKDLSANRDLLTLTNIKPGVIF